MEKGEKEEDQEEGYAKKEKVRLRKEEDVKNTSLKMGGEIYDEIWKGILGKD